MSRLASGLILLSALLPFAAPRAQPSGAPATSAIPDGTTVSLGNLTVTNADLFGAPALRVGAPPGRNAVVGLVDNQGPPGTATFPTGVTGYGNLRSSGGTVFGLFGRADLRSPGTATNELNAFNYCGPPSARLPPDTSFGTKECNAIPLQVIPYGDHDSGIGVLFGPGLTDAGNAPVRFRTMIYARPGTFTDGGVVLDGGPDDAATGLAITRGGAGAHVALRSVGTAAPTAPVISYADAAGDRAFAVLQNGEAIASRAVLAPTPFASLPSPVAGKVAYCSDCFAAPSTTERGTLVFGNGRSWMAVQSAPAKH